MKAFCAGFPEEIVMFFQSSAPGGHDNYFKELSNLRVDSHGKPSESDMVAMREKKRHYPTDTVASRT